MRKRTGTITHSPPERRDFLRDATLRHSRTPTEWRMSWQGIRPPKYVHFPNPNSRSISASGQRLVERAARPEHLALVGRRWCTVPALLGWAWASHARRRMLSLTLTLLPYCCPDLDESSVFGFKPYRRHTTHHHQGLMRAHCLARSSARRK